MPRACTLCGSTRWRRDGITGLVVCEDGHVLQDFRNENNEVEGPSAFALQKRTIKKNRTSRRKAEDGKNPKYYHGDNAEYLKLQAFQHLLRLQVQALSKLWALPDVFELIIRDLWAHHLATALLPSNPSSDDAEHGADIPTSSDNATSQKSIIRATPLVGLDEEKKDDSDTEGEASSAESTPDLEAELMRELDDEDAGGEVHVHEEVDARGKHRWKLKQRVVVSDTLVVLVTGLWVLRWPVVFTDVECLVNGNFIPYIDFGHSTLLPAAMRPHVNRETMLAISPLRCPSSSYLFSTCRQFARVLHRHFSITLPEINLPLVSWRMVRGVGGTPTIHYLVQRLLAFLNVDLTLTETFGLVRRRSRSRSRSRSKGGKSRSHSRVRSRPRVTKPRGGRRMNGRAGYIDRLEGSDDEDDDAEEEAGDIDIDANEDDDSDGDDGAMGRTTPRRSVHGGSEVEDGVDGNDRNGSAPPDNDGEDEEEEEREKTFFRAKLYQDSIMPEAAVLGAWIILMKMVYGLDDEERILDKDDPAIGLPSLPGWVAELETKLRLGGLLGDRRYLQPSDITVKSDDELDRILGMAEQVLLKDREMPDSNILAPFPLPPHASPPGPSPLTFSHLSSPSDPSSESSAAPSPLLPPSSPSPPSSPPSSPSPHATASAPAPAPLRIGDLLSSYEASDTTGVLPHAYEVCLGAAAAVAGVSVREMAGVVQVFERRLERMKKVASFEGKRGKGRPKKGERSRAGSVSGGKGRARRKSLMDLDDSM